MAKRELSLPKQVEKIQTDRTYLRTVIQSVITTAKAVPGAIKPAVVDELQTALDRTAD